MKISEHLISEYRNANYCVTLSGAETVLRIGQPSIELASLLTRHAASGAVFITAWNPLGNVLSESENISANKLLKQGLARIATVVLSGYGSSPDGTRREESFLALPVSRHDAAELCCRYAQNAVVFISPSGVPELIFHPHAGTTDPLTPRNNRAT